MDPDWRGAVEALRVPIPYVRRGRAVSKTDAGRAVRKAKRSKARRARY